MENRAKKYNAIKREKLQNELAVNKALQEAGMYLESHVFPVPSLQFELTTHCNAACKHCYNNSGLCNNVPDRMTSEKWIDFAEYLVNHGGVFECLLSGGEPLLLGENLFKIMDILHEDGSCFMLLTNAYLMTAEKAKRFSKYRYHWLQISIDGVGAEYHDAFRQKNGSWERAVKGASLVAENGIPLKIAHCVTPYNLQDIDDMCDLAYSLGASCITVGELCLSGRVAQNTDLLLSNDQREILYRKVKENFYRYQGRMRIKSSNSVRSGLERHFKRPNSGAIIRPNGDIRLDGMAPFVIGNILKEDFAEVWAKKLNKCWQDAKVEEFISSFNEDDRNYQFINYVEDDIKIAD
ncbi:MAG: radical SAM protein [Lachnospiraceae bacterium]|nr:radical SAM protein [Lachnospiraceae bacterium]